MKTKPHHTPPDSDKGMPLHSFCDMDDETLVLNILGCNAIDQPKGKQFRVSATAATVAGRATDRMERFLASEFAVTPSNIEVLFGRYNINKNHASERRRTCRRSSPGILRRKI